MTMAMLARVRLLSSQRSNELASHQLDSAPPTVLIVLSIVDQRSHQPFFIASETLTTMPFFTDELRARPIGVTGIENALLDLHVDLPDDAKLTEMGLTKGTMKLVDTEEQRKILEHVGNLDPWRQPGGSCANVLRTVSMLGGNTCYSSAVGLDAEGEAFIQGLVDAGVMDRCARLDQGATGTSVILVSADGERTMNTHLGACRDYAPEHVPHQDIRNSQIFFTTAYIWDTPNQIDAIEQAIAAAREANCRIAIDLADPFAVDRSRERINQHIQRGLDVVFANAEEAKIMTGLGVEGAAHKLAETIRIAVVTDGAKGALIVAGDTRIHVPAEKVTVVDTTGAGDSFAAGFLHGLINDLSPEVCGKIATALAADCITHMGVKLSDGIEQRVAELSQA